MKVTVTLLMNDKDGQAVTKTYNNVAETGLTQQGLYMIMNVDKMPIAQFPISVIACVECPEHDTAISLIKGKVEL